MKARIKATGEIINIADSATVTLDVCNEFGNPMEKRFDEVEILQEKTSDDGIDWEQRRYEIARANLQGYISTKPHVMYFDKVVEFCINVADELIEELKKRNDEEE